jgi:hypothetical protein
MQTVFQKFGVEIHQQADPVSVQTEIGQNLRYMHGQNAFHRLYFDDNGILHDDIGAVATRQADALVNHGKDRLPYKGQAVLFKFSAKAFPYTSSSTPGPSAR